MESADFEATLAALPEDYRKGIFEGRRYGVGSCRSNYGRRYSLFARDGAQTWRVLTCIVWYRETHLSNHARCLRRKWETSSWDFDRARQTQQRTA